MTVRTLFFYYGVTVIHKVWTTLENILTDFLLLW